MCRIAFLLSLAISFSSCNNRQEESIQNDFHWLIGSWTKLNNEDGQKTYESWQAHHGALLGLGCTLEGSDTIFKERMALIDLGDSVVFRVEGVHDHAVDFKLKQNGLKSFKAECPTNEFPRQIEYHRRGDTLYARLSGNETNIEYAFIKK